MSRNLLPRLRSAPSPSPANIPTVAVGRWTRLASPGDLEKLDYKLNEESELRTRIQSIPSPWARLMLFRSAMENPQHPARKLVENEILDGLEFLWSLGTTGLHPTVARIRLEDLADMAESTGSERVLDFAQALTELAPRVSGKPAFETMSVVIIDGRPILGSSPFTILFTAEDAAGSDTGAFFKYAGGKAARPLAERPEAFQRYIARVVLPQLTLSDASDHDVDWAFLQNHVREWLDTEVKSARKRARSEVQRERLTPLETANTTRSDISSQAAQLGAESIDGLVLGGVTVYRSRPGSAIEQSRWRLRARRGGADAPIVVDKQYFDGHYFAGAPSVRLPNDFAALDRGVLPGISQRHAWVSPVDDWFTSEILLFNDELDTDKVQGFSQYRASSNAGSLAVPRMTLPLRREFFRWFSPEDVDQMVTIEVQSSGAVEVSLKFQVGSEDENQELVVRRTYDPARIRPGVVGPAVGIWPSFRHSAWSRYAIFRTDTNQSVASYYKLIPLREGQPIQSEQEQRTPLVGVVAVSGIPEVLEFERTEGGVVRQSESLGVLIPRYGTAPAPNQTRWAVGVDFGTSNTVVSVRSNDDPAAQLFSAEALVLQLTRLNESGRALRDAYFFPEQIENRPFGTAVVHLVSLPNLDLSREPIALRVNIPFEGEVDGYQTNKVLGDLKWSAERNARFLSASFLRHLLATIFAEAIRFGVSPQNVSLSWAYPRAFTPDQRNQLSVLWETVIREFSSLGVKPTVLEEPLDESRSVLRHFFNAGQADAVGDLTVIVDIGGGTSDIAAYEHGTVRLLDSVLLGGRNLTGSRMQAATADELKNGFVECFVAWARDNGLPTEPYGKAVDAYLRNGQVHLAFSYLVGTEWFKENGPHFAARSEFQRFQVLVLYFFGALSYYVGLGLRGPNGDGSSVTLPHTLLLAGNGSRYLDWLTGLKRGSPQDVFRKALGRILAAGAGILQTERAPTIEQSKTPKEEVARGLVARVRDDELIREAEGQQNGPTIGEAISGWKSVNGSQRDFSITDRVSVGDLLDASGVATLQWAEGKLEIERFHDALIAVARTLVSHGAHWHELARALEQSLAKLRRDDLIQATRNRIAYLTQQERGYSGSVFILEASVVLERLNTALFT